ncbi:hypothetical protein HF295_06000 [Hujiaoplasma nucleasis]|uniref:Uncharacterized protein n=1 Tax=Hujiaoplasma nucleasis TaxID=2725268 RepID=A0A7L6N4J9_9MOLU|nr:hypothetical protein [Hujiaoplasma nucleasis]QLY40422.1 hypothetical protein HF295_06000 [Hujiaoplasma nucleasis]
MKVFGRFLYAMFAVGIFLVAFQLSVQWVFQKYVEDVFGNSLTDENSDLPDFYYFYASLPDYHKEEPLIEINENGYQIRAFEIVRTEIKEDILTVNEFMLFLIYHEDPNALKDIDKIRISNGLTKDQIDIQVAPYKELDILVSIDLDTQYIEYIINKDLIDFSKNYDSLLLIDQNQTTLFESAFNLSDESFMIKGNIEGYYEEYENLPEDELNGIGVYSQDKDITNNSKIVDEYLYIFGIVFGAYFVVLIVATYLIFFKKRKEKPKAFLG